MDRKEAYGIIKEARSLLASVPSSKWVKNVFTNQIDSCCAIGHHQRLTSNDTSDYSERNCDDTYAPDSLRMACGVFGFCIASINNGAETVAHWGTEKGGRKGGFLPLPYILKSTCPKTRTLKCLDWILEEYKEFDDARTKHIPYVREIVERASKSKVPVKM